MGSIVPVKRVDKVQFYEDHIVPFTTNAVAIGITTTEVTDLDTKTDAARAAYTARQAAKSATELFYNAVNTMGSAGAAIIKKIRAKVEQTGNPNLYALAQIPAPQAPSPVPPPGTPTHFKVSLSQGGALTLAWKCPNPAGAVGTIYQVSQRVGTSGPLTFIGATGNKKFIDQTLPTGSSSITYRIVAVRSTAQGPEALFTVNFGVSAGGGEMMASIAEESAPKLAA